MENFKEIITALSVIFVIVLYLIYFRDIFLTKTKPHVYTWLIWSITMGVAAASAISGGAGYGSFPLILGAGFMTGITVVSIKYGTKNITRSDTIALIFALGSVVIWWQLNNPYLAVFIASMIDMIGYYPTFRKSYFEPESETVSFWALSLLGITLNIVALDEYNFLTLFYLATIFFSSGSLAIFLLVRKKQLGVLS